MYKQKVKCLFLDNSLDNSQSADVNRGYLSLLLSNSGTLRRVGVHVPWTCDYGPRRVDGLLVSLGGSFVSDIFKLLKVMVKVKKW